MKSRILKKSLLMMMAALILMSVIAVSANAEELLPEACGGEVYIEEETDVNAVPDAAEITDVLMKADNTPEPAESTEPAEITEAPETVEAPNTAAAAETTEVSGTAEITETTEPAEIAEITETAGIKENSDVSVETEKMSGLVAGIGIEAKVVPHPHPHDPDEDAVRDKNVEISRKAGDVIIKIGETLIPFGPSISNFIRSRSPEGKNMDKVDAVIDLAADTASFAFPIAAPLVSVAKDIVLKIWNLF